MKNIKAEMMMIRSSQSAFSRAVMSCLEVSMSELRESWVCEVARSVAVDSSDNMVIKYDPEADFSSAPYRASG